MSFFFQQHCVDSVEGNVNKIQSEQKSDILYLFIISVNWTRSKYEKKHVQVIGKKERVSISWR